MLTETTLKNLKTQEKPYKASDTGGLFVLINPNGSKLWRLKYRYDGKEKLLSVGAYPAIGLKQARTRRDEAKAQLANGIDPSTAKQQAKAEQQQETEVLAYTFGQAFEDWHAFKLPSWSKGYADDVEARARMYLIPRLGKKALTTITPPDVLATLKDCESGGKLDTLKKVRSILSQVFRFAVGMGRLPSDPSRDVSADVFQQPPKKNLAHQTDPVMIKGIYQTIRAPYSGFISVKNAMRLLPLTVLRANELCGLKWSEVDMDAKVLRIPAERMKMKKEHLVPLSRQAIEVLENQQANHVGGEFVFFGARTHTRPITIEALLAGMRRQGIAKDEFSNHGWRHSFSTMMHELQFTPHAIEAQLAHVLQGVAGVYNKAQYLPERTRMMQTWADWLENLTTTTGSNNNV
jgi:integrase